MSEAVKCSSFIIVGGNEINIFFSHIDIFL